MKTYVGAGERINFRPTPYSIYMPSGPDVPFLTEAWGAHDSGSVLSQEKACRPPRNELPRLAKDRAAKHQWHGRALRVLHLLVIYLRYTTTPIRIEAKRDGIRVGCAWPDTVFNVVTHNLVLVCSVLHRNRRIEFIIIIVWYKKSEVKQLLVHVKQIPPSW